MKQRKLVDSFEEYLKQESNKNPINKKIKDGQYTLLLEFLLLVCMS
jgi:hypothetical protein